MKKMIIFYIIIALVVIGGGIAYILYTPETKYEESDLDVVISLEDKVTNNSIWCGTFNLVWNDLKSEVAKMPIKFDTQMDIVDNLNKGTFNVSYLDEDSYYKKFGRPTPKLKEEIEQGIKDKFNETSDILDSFDFTDSEEDDYFLYVMLKKVFEFPEEFKKLGSSTFKDTENVEYFGIDGIDTDTLRKQVKVLFYDNENTFAVKLLTKTNDEVILSRGINKDNFLDIFKEINRKASLYRGNNSMIDKEKLMVPDMSLKLKKEFKELQNKNFMLSNGKQSFIDAAVQTIEFELDSKGGKIKSEAGIGVRNTSISDDELRSFIFNDTFVIFLQEKGRTLPYFAGKISDIKNVQDVK